MNRWLAWFLCGAALFLLSSLGVIVRTPTLEGLGLLAAALFFAWLYITIPAVPIAIVVWLVRRPTRPGSVG